MYFISKQQLNKFQKALVNFNLSSLAERIGSEILARAEFEALNSEMHALRNQIKEYETIKSGALTRFTSSDIGDLPMMIIHARIARGLSQRELANLVGLKEQQIQRYESEKYSSASLNRLREIAKALNLSITEIVELNAEKLKAENLSSDSEELEWQKFPIKEMYKREWFENFSGSLNAALQDGESLVKQFITRVRNRPVLALHRKRVRAESIIDEYKLLAWECRVLSLADKAKINYKYDHGSIDHKWLTELIQKSRLTDGPRMAQDQLREAGIAMIIEPQMPNTHLAACLRADKYGIKGFLCQTFEIFTQPKPIFLQA